MAPPAQHVENYRSQLAQNLLCVEGKPFSLADYPMYPAVFDGDYQRVLLKTARQVIKSTTLACFGIVESISIPFFKTFFIEPTREQTSKFSNTRVSKILSHSPTLRRHFVGPESIDNVLLRLFRNGSEMAFSYALDDADRARGYSADRCSFDEVQDMLYEAVIPVIEECMSNSDYQYSIYAGTPKTTENTIEFLWSLSTQSEWIMRCDGCGKHTFIVGVKALGADGPECLNCRKPLNPRRGRWVDMKPNARIKGFHLSQPMMPANVPAAFQDPERQERARKRWRRILEKQLEYGDSKFLNEVIGVSTSTGVRLLTQEILQSMCRDYDMTRLPLPTSLQGVTRTVAGVDWSGGGGEVKGKEGLVKSRTVLHIWGDLGNGQLKTLYYKIFPNAHATGWVPEIVELCNAWNVHMVCGDAGEGALANAMLREKLGPHRVIQLRYMALSRPIEWNAPALCYHADRTTLIDNYAAYLQRQSAVFPKLPQAQPAFNDILNEYEETTTQGRKVWRHAPTQPDDALHAQLFGWIAWRVLCGDLKFY
jgi:hypothetical protein